MQTERRSTTDQVKLIDNAIVGYAAVFHDGSEDTQYELWRGAVERIDPHAFAEALRSDDAVALMNHDANLLLGRVSAGTLKLSVDKRGLRYEIPYDEGDEDHRRVRRKIERGDLSGSSFAFQVTKQEWRHEANQSVRLIQSVKLMDVGPVTFPCYRGSSASLRSDHLAEARSSFEAWQQSEPTRIRIERARMLSSTTR